jgi:hypothetical protein
VINEYGRTYYPLPERAEHPNSGLTERFEPDLSLLPLVSPFKLERAKLHARKDGWLTAAIAPGDYALVMGSARRDWKYRYEAVALLQVPPGATSTYTGDLTITVATDNTSTLFEPQPYHVVQLDVSRRPESIAAFASGARTSAEPVEPAVSLWCLVIDPHTRLEELQYGAAIISLNLGCVASPREQ